MINVSCSIGTTPFIQEGEKCALSKEGQPPTVVIVLRGAKHHTYFNILRHITQQYHF